MCLIVYKPETAKFDKAILANGWRMNDDGAGFMAWDGRRKLIVKRGFFSFKELIEALEPYAHLRCAVHFRWATHGLKDAANCHPFKITKRLAMMHNGIITNIEMTDKRFSDTWHFARVCANTLQSVPNFWRQADKKLKIETVIGNGNKLVFMDNLGNVEIYNEDEGSWLDGCWYSNTLFTFGSYAGLNRANKRIEMLNQGQFVAPYELSPYEVDDGETWYRCENCYCEFTKEENPPINVAGFTVCLDCYKEVGEYLEPANAGPSTGYSLNNDDGRPFDERDMDLFSEGEYADEFGWR